MPVASDVKRTFEPSGAIDGPPTVVVARNCSIVYRRVGRWTGPGPSAARGGEVADAETARARARAVVRIMGASVGRRSGRSGSAWTRARIGRDPSAGALPGAFMRPVAATGRNTPFRPRCRGASARRRGYNGG